MEYIEIMKTRLQELQIQKNELESKLRPILTELRSIEEFLARMGGESLPEPAVPSEYPVNENLKTKIKYVLTVLGKGTASEVLNYMVERGENTNLNSVSTTMSVMRTEEELQSVGKVGRATIYSL